MHIWSCIHGLSSDDIFIGYFQQSIFRVYLELILLTKFWTKCFEFFFTSQFLEHIWVLFHWPNFRRCLFEYFYRSIYSENLELTSLT